MLLADEATEAAKLNDPRKCYKLIGRIAPKPTSASVTVIGTDGKTCMYAETEVIARKQALLEIFRGSEIPMTARPTSAAPPAGTEGAPPLAQLASCTTAEVTKIVNLMPNH